MFSKKWLSLLGSVISLFISSTFPVYADHGVMLVTPSDRALGSALPQDESESTTDSLLRKLGPTSTSRQQIQAIEGRDFKSLNSYPPGSPEAKLGRSVGWLRVDANLDCTAFLIAPDLVITSRHCAIAQDQASDVTRASRYRIYMEYQNANQPGPLSSLIKKVELEAVDLDLLVLRLSRPLGKRYGWLKLADQVPEGPQEIWIIQHPKGRAKEIAKQANAIPQRYEQVIHYTADTEPGSSGSPVFCRGSNEVVAMHHAAVGSFNEGVKASVIKQRLAPLLSRTIQSD